jgi:phosphoglycerol transferase
LKYVSGVAQREDWGRWTDSNQGGVTLFGFTKPLPERFTLELKVAPYGPNISKPTRIRVGSQEKTIIVDGKKNIYSLDFESLGSVDAIEITAPRSKLSKSESLSSADPRNIGIGLIHLRIKDRDKLP